MPWYNCSPQMVWGPSLRVRAHFVLVIGDLMVSTGSKALVEMRSFEAPSSHVPELSRAAAPFFDT